ncbi:hypothetical protein FRC07_007273, partial [Ceratobasidium sp. 392]
MAEVSDGPTVGIRWLDNVTNIMQLDPTGGAKVAFSLCTKAREHLEAQEKQDNELNELVETIAGLIPAVDLVKDLANTSLSHTITSMLNVVEDLSLFILKSKDRGLLDMQETTQQYITMFRRLRREFDTMVSTQVLAESTNEHRAAQMERREAGTERQASEIERQVSETERRATETERIRVKLRELNPANLAGYDPERECVAGTRTGILDELTDWAGGLDPGSCFAWVHGQAGLGKSSIATSLCVKLDGQHMLASSFFCKRDSPDLRDPRRVLTTLACGIASRWGAYRDAVVRIIGEDLELQSKPIRRLYDALVGGLLPSLAGAERPTGVLVVVVDALDECGDADTRKQLLACLQGMTQLGPWLRIVVTSRPDANIMEYFSRAGAGWFVEYDVQQYDAAEDIRVFVHDQLSVIKHVRNWPDDAVEQVALRSNKLFIWARTACKFIVDGHDRRKRLEQVLAGTQLIGIDSLYATMIKASTLDA